MAISNLVQDLFQRVREAMKTNSSKSWEETVTALEADVEAKRAARRAVERRFDEGYFQTFGDEVAMRRLRKDVRDAEGHLRDSEDSLSRAIKARDLAKAAEDAADIEGQWQRAEKIAFQLQDSGEALQVALDEVAKQVERAFEIGKRLYAALPSPPEVVPPVINAATLVNYIDLYLCGRTAGKMLPRVPTLLNAHQLNQGPDLSHRFAESVALAMKRRPSGSTFEPPSAA